MQVSVIIVTYNTRKMTLECIDSVFEKTKDVEFEVILVDNASADGSKKMFERDNRITYIYSPENLGFGRANNLGYEYSKGEFIFLLNSDTLLLNNAIYEFYNYMKQTSADVGCVGCQLTDRDGDPMHSAGKFPGVPQFWHRITHFTFYELYKKTGYKEPPFICTADVDYITGADLFIRRSVVEKYGLFDPDFFMYFEETEMQWRYAKQGVGRQIIVEPKIKHLAGASNKRSNHSLAGVIREMRSRYIYCRKTMGSFLYHVIAFMHLLMLPRLIISRAPMTEKKELTELIISNL